MGPRDHIRRRIGPTVRRADRLAQGELALALLALAGGRACAIARPRARAHAGHAAPSPPTGASRSTSPTIRSGCCCASSRSLGDYPDRPGARTSAAARRSRRAPRGARARLRRSHRPLRRRHARCAPRRSCTYAPPAARHRADGTPMRWRIYRLRRPRCRADARTLRWFYGIVVDPYPLTIRRADGTSTTEWIGGTAWSGPIDLTASSSPPTRLEVSRQYLVAGLHAHPAEGRSITSCSCSGCSC